MTNTTNSVLAPERLFPALRAAFAAADRWTAVQFNAPLTHELLQGGAR